MKTRISRLLLVTVFSLFSLCSYGQCEAKIKAFYVAYMQNAENNEADNVKLLKAHMSPELIAKLKELTQKYDADAIIHAQDVCAYGVRSLIVIPQTEDWYLVKYKWSPEDDYTCIPVRATDKNGKLAILDILPTDSVPVGESKL